MGEDWTEQSRRSSFAWELVVAAYCLGGMSVTLAMVAGVHGVSEACARELLDLYVSRGFVKHKRIGGKTRYVLPENLPRLRDTPWNAGEVGEALCRDDYLGGEGVCMSGGDSIVAWRKGVFAIARDCGFVTYGDFGLRRDLKGALVARAVREQKWRMLPKRPRTPEQRARDRREANAWREYEGIAELDL